MAFDLLIQNGLIVDGTGNPWYRADIGVVNDRIEAVGRLPADAVTVIDAGGRVVCPGFIDMHAHSDLLVLVDPYLPAKLQQGVTTEVISQDGMSAAPVSAATAATWAKILAGVDGNPPIEWRWSSLGGYLAALRDARPAANFASLIPYGNVRSLVMGFGPEPSGARQLDQMKAVVAQGMEEGAYGMSMGLIYQPQMYGSREELLELYKVVGRYGGMMAVHMRNEGDVLLEAADEVIGICLEAGCTLHLSHLKVAGRRNWAKGPLLLEKIEQARARGLEVTFDQYPYTAASTSLYAVLPPWASQGGVELMMDRLRDVEQRAKIAWQIEHLVGDNRPTTDPTLRFWENFVGAAGWESILITSVGHSESKGLEGTTVAELAAAHGVAPAEFAFDLLLREAGNVTMAAFISTEENVRLFLAHDYGTIGSDGILVGKPHPRAYGTFPRVLGEYVRQQALLPLPQMIRRMTSLPAQRLHLHDRGLIRPGMKADIVVFDPSLIRDTATYADPCRYPVGIQAVIVNGAVAVENGNVTGERRGRILLRG